MFFFPADLRVADADRDEAVEFLTHHYAAGRLSEGEFDRRVDAAHRARYESQLVRITDDLPAVLVPSPRPGRLAAVGPAVKVAAVAAAVLAVLALVPADAWAPLFAMLIPLAIMLVFAVGPFALPVLAFVWLARMLGGSSRPQRAHLPPHRGMGRLGPWDAMETRRR